MKGKVLHVSVLDKFLPDFISLVRENFDKGSHYFFTFGDKKKYPYNSDLHTCHHNVFFSIKSIGDFLSSVKASDKIIIHGLFHWQLMILILFTPWVHKKFYWVIWGGDLYCHELDRHKKHYKLMEIMRKFVIFRFGGLITYIDGDYERAKKWYLPTGFNDFLGLQTHETHIWF